MTIAEIKTEIQNVLDNIPEHALNDVLTFLKKIQNHPGDKLKLADHIRQILEEDKELLEKLAQ